MNRLIGLVGLMLLLASTASAQGLSLAFDQEGVDQVTVANYTYGFSINGAARVNLPVICTGNGPTLFTCLTPINPSDTVLFPAGAKHSINVVTCDGVICSAPSPSVSFTVPKPARNLRLQ